VNKKGRKNEEGNEIGEALRSLKHVEAPANFEFGVKAKIAHCKPSEKSSVSRFVRYAVPAALVLVVGAVLVLNNLYLAGERSAAGVPEVTEPKTAPVVNTAQQLPSNIEKTAPEQQLVASADAPAANPQRFAKSAPNVVQRKVSNELRGGSYDASQRLLEPIYPKVKTTPKPLQTGEIDVQSAFSSLGIEAIFNGKTWKVGSVKPSSVAERAGIKTGDETEAIDGQKITETLTFKAPFAAKTLSVIRDGKPVNISIH
jgi:hypothetical protein